MSRRREERAAWVMYAQRQGPDAAGEFAEFGDAEWVRMCYGEPVVAVDVTEDADGSYWGWIDIDDDTPTMIQPHEGMYTMQFAYGPEAEEKAGRGWTVRLNVEEHQMSATTWGVVDHDAIGIGPDGHAVTIPAGRYPVVVDLDGVPDHHIYLSDPSDPHTLIACVQATDVRID